MVWYLVAGAGEATRTLFFPLSTRMGLPDSASLRGETRSLPNKKNIEEDVQLLVEDLVLGPLLPENAPFLPPATRIESVVYDRGKLYINISRDFVEENPEWVSIEDQLQAVANTVLFNFPRIKNLFLFIDGQIPVFEKSGVDLNEGMAFDRQQLR